MNPYWSYLLTAVGVFGLYLAGRKDRRGWMVGIGAQVLWIAYATATHQWGFYVSAVAYGWVYARNAHAWKPRGATEADDLVTLWHIALGERDAARADANVTRPYVFDLVDSVMNSQPLDFHGHVVPLDVQAALKPQDGSWHPVCRYCGADCSEGRSWDGGDLYACPPCAERRADAHRAGGHRANRCTTPYCVHPSHGRGL